jgi:hypothetical protein
VKKPLTRKLLSSLISLSLLSLMACERRVKVTEQMTWEIAPDEYKPGFDAKPNEYVRLRYVTNPECWEVESGKGLAAGLIKAGKRVVNVDIAAWGVSGQLRGYGLTSVDGRVIEAGPWGHSGRGGTPSCPLDAIFVK